ncbi:MAG: FAD-dependent oxidoreductase [Spirochaetaceae bacterium]|nr:FAD-dependent oxidoreductase [Spirochaetaceae bacterium]
MADVIVKIDGKEITVPIGSTVLEAAKKAGYDIPVFCNAEGLKPFTSCFVCVVKIEGGKGNFVPSCATIVREGMSITVESPEINAARKMCVTLLVSDHCGDCLPPCQTACPASIDIKGFLKAIADNKPEQAAEIIREKAPLPGSLGRICPRPCEDECRRTRVEQPVSICNMKRFASDKEIEKQGKIKLNNPLTETGKKVAIIGSGPAGMSAAYFLRQQGHDVTVFEKNEKSGGMLRYGIPFYRLPDKILSMEMDAIEKTGVKVKYNTEIGKDININLLQKDYDALLIAIGAQGASSMRVEGETLPGVYSGIDYLGKIARGEFPDLGKKVFVVGGGNTAIDASRSAVRSGADVSILYRRTKSEMPASDFEITEAEEEGIKIEYLVAPVSITSKDNKLYIKCIRMGQGEPDESGRRRPVPIKDSEFEVEADTIIGAIGQRVLSESVATLGIGIDKSGNIITDPHTFMTSRPGIFAAGDCQTGADIAVRAVGNGRKAACSIDQYLSGKEVAVVGEQNLFNSQMGPLDSVPDTLFEGIEQKERIKMPLINLNERKKTYNEIETGFEYDKAVVEAERCLKCGCDKIEDCKLRTYATRFDVDQNFFKGEKRTYTLDISRSDIKMETGKCITCGSCVRACAEIKKLNIFSFVNRGFKTRMTVPFGKSLVDSECDGCGECAKVCPTAAIVMRKNQ